MSAAGARAIALALEHGPPRDEHGDFRAVLRRGRLAARELGHDLVKWHKRPYAPNTAATAVCGRCDAMALVDVERSSFAYGPALVERCN